MKATWKRLGGFAKAFVILMTLFVVANFAYYLSGSSPYKATDMLALIGIFVAGLLITVISDRIFQAFWPSRDS